MMLEVMLPPQSFSSSLAAAESAENMYINFYFHPYTHSAFIRNEQKICFCVIKPHVNISPKSLQNKTR